MNALPHPAIWHLKGFSWSWHALICLVRFDFCNRKQEYGWLKNSLENITRSIQKSINLAYIGKGVFTTLKSAFHPFTRGHLVMGLQMPLDVLLQVLFSTYLTLNILMARLVMSPQIFNICKHLHAAGFTAQYLHIVQFNCKEKQPSNFAIPYTG